MSKQPLIVAAMICTISTVLGYILYINQSAIAAAAAPHKNYYNKHLKGGHENIFLRGSCTIGMFQQLSNAQTINSNNKLYNKEYFLYE